MGLEPIAYVHVMYMYYGRENKNREDSGYSQTTISALMIFRQSTFRYNDVGLILFLLCSRMYKGKERKSWLDSSRNSSPNMFVVTKKDLLIVQKLRRRGSPALVSLLILLNHLYFYVL